MAQIPKLLPQTRCSILPPNPIPSRSNATLDHLLTFHRDHQKNNSNIFIIHNSAGTNSNDTTTNAVLHTTTKPYPFNKGTQHSTTYHRDYQKNKSTILIIHNSNGTNSNDTTHHNFSLKKQSTIMIIP